MYRRWATILGLCLPILLSFSLGGLGTYDIHLTYLYTGQNLALNQVNSICTSSLTASLHFPCLVGPCLHLLQQIDHPGTQLVHQQLQARPDCFC
ncbi:hypothetical protein B0H14DRAFT_2842222, partial [Mycena olivaceomarginata]